MAKPNRVILTASRRDRPSFGCQVDRIYNFFDECFLATLTKSKLWQASFDAARQCVRWKEEALAMAPSEPQAYFGSAVGRLRVGF